MKRQAAMLLVLALCASPAAAMAGSFSWSTPWTSGSVSGDSSSNVNTSGSVGVNNTTVDWSLAVDKSAQTASASAVVNGQEYSGSFNWSDLFSWLFG